MTIGTSTSVPEMPSKVISNSVVLAVPLTLITGATSTNGIADDGASLSMGFTATGSVYGYGLNTLAAIWGGGKSNGATACVPVIGAGAK